MVRTEIIINNYNVIIPLLGLGLLMVSSNFKPAYAEDCKFTAPSSAEEATKDAEFFCKTKGGEDYDKWCLTSVKPYFEANDETEDAIKEFLGLCNEISIIECATMAIKLKGFCYNFERAVKLSRVVDKLYTYVLPQKSHNGGKVFDLNYFVWEKYAAYKGVSIEQCIGHVAEVVRALDASYAAWHSKQNGKADCNCEELEGITDFVAGEGEEKQRTIEDLYKDFCYDDDGKPKEYHWTAKQLKRIAESKDSYDNKKKFIQSAYKIGKAGWLSNKATEWRYSFMNPYLSPNSFGTYEDNTDFLAAGIAAEFTENEFQKFSWKSNIGTSVTDKCRTDILNGVFTPVGKNKFFGKMSKDNFCDDIEMLLFAFQEGNPTRDCTTFKDGLLILQDELDSMKISESDYRTRLLASRRTNTKLEDLAEYIKSH